MTQWTDKHYDLTYTLTEKDVERGSIKLDPYFVSKQWKVGSKDDSGALFHILKTIARFGDKNDVEREVKALHAQVLGVARSFGIDLEHAQTISFDETRVAQTQASLWYPDDSGEWIDTNTYDFESTKEHLAGRYMEVLAECERAGRPYMPSIQKFEYWFGGCADWGNAVAFKLVK